MTGKPLEDQGLPVEIVNDEIIVRALLTPYHIKNGAARRQALKPPSNQKSISVIRQRMGTDFCKGKAKELASNIGPKMKPTNTYWGLLSIGAGDIRATGAAVHDSREEYLGHADLDLGLPVSSQDDPVATPQEQKAMQDRMDALLALAKSHHDPAPMDEHWAGPSIEAAHVKATLPST